MVLALLALAILSCSLQGGSCSCPIAASGLAVNLAIKQACCSLPEHRSKAAGTILHGTRTPLTVWFSAAWHLTSGKGGISATELQREMQFGSYQTARRPRRRLPRNGAGSSAKGPLAAGQ